MNKNTKEILIEKEKLIKQIQQLSKELLDKKYEVKKLENNIIINTDFKRLGLSNKDSRRAYVQDKTWYVRHERDVLQNEVSDLKRQLDLCNDKLKIFL